MTTTAPEARAELPQTGGAFRTPRSEITPLRVGKYKYEPAAAWDLSPSMYWSAQDEQNRAEEYPHPNSRRAIMEQFAPLFISRLAKEDAEAAKEQATGSDEKGGVFSVGFDAKTIEIGDLNESNYQRKMEDAWNQARNAGTKLAPAIQALIDDYEDEFTSDPEGTRVHEIAVITDGEPEDAAAVLPYLKAANRKRVYVIGILGHGTKAKKTYDIYKKAADENKAADPHEHENIHVVLFDGVTSPTEIAEDLIFLAC
jgi:hypothetical protein